MEYQFEEFTSPPDERGPQRLHASINKRGTIYLGRHAFEALSEPERVVLFYDNRNSTMGIKRAPESRPNAFKVRRKEKGKNYGFMIFAAVFCRHYHIRPEGTLKFTNAKVNKDGLLVLNFQEATKSRRY